MCYRGVSCECSPGPSGLLHCVQGWKWSHSKFQACVRWKRQENSPGLYSLRNVLSADAIHSPTRLSCGLTLLCYRPGQNLKVPFCKIQLGWDPDSHLQSQPWQENWQQSMFCLGGHSWGMGSCLPFSECSCSRLLLPYGLSVSWFVLMRKGSQQKFLWET